LTLRRTVSTTIQTNRCASSIRLNETHMTKRWPVMRFHGPRRESRQRFRRFAGTEPLRMLDTDSLQSVRTMPTAHGSVRLGERSTETCVRRVCHDENRFARSWVFQPRRSSHSGATEIKIHVEQIPPRYGEGEESRQVWCPFSAETGLVVLPYLIDTCGRRQSALESGILPTCFFF
jgi:hypothetical protein